VNVVPGQFYRSAAEEVWCCFARYEAGRFGVIRLRDARVSYVDMLGEGENLKLVAQTFECRA
jgi:hypothetical protein